MNDSPQPLTASASLTTAGDRIPPVRGIVAVQNATGALYDIEDIGRWILINRTIHKTEKLDVVANGIGLKRFDDVFEPADRHDVRISLRTDCETPPERLQEWAARGLLDVCLTPRDENAPGLEQWIAACNAAALPTRIQVQLPLKRDTDPVELAKRLTGPGVKVVNVVLNDPAQPKPGCESPGAGQLATAQANRLVQSLSNRGVEVNLVGVPFCYVYPGNRPYAENSLQFHADHQQYVEGSYELFRKIHPHSPYIFNVTIQLVLIRHTLHGTPFDSILLPFLLYHGNIRMIVGFYRRFTRRLRIFRGVPDTVDTSPEAYERERARKNWLNQRTMGRRCSICSLRRVCDHVNPDVKQVLNKIEARPFTGEMVVSPFHFNAAQPKYYDPVDANRRRHDDGRAAQADAAIRTITNREPDLRVGPSDYGVEDCYYGSMESGLKWFSVSNKEILSTPLARLTPPFTIAADFGAGIADYIGFSIGRHCKILCRMEAYRHHLVLDVDPDGNYLLLRDRKPVAPVQFVDNFYLPRRVGSYVSPRISVWNIEDQIATQNVQIWTGAQPERPSAPTVKYSVVIVSTRFTRRLQAVLRAIAKQNFPLQKIEVVVCYVPGLDATDDLLDSVQLAYPNLRVLRAPFAKEKANAKGFMINEAMEYATGEWIMLLDSDTLIPPNMFAEVDRRTDGAHFIAPDGRKLLDKPTTHKILLGEIDPAKEWTALLKGPGEFRHRETKGIPVGFCQCVRAQDLREIKYAELDYFEFSDMWFGDEMIKKHGKETRLTGLPVLHLDHGGSQWYGAQRHM